VGNQRPSIDFSGFQQRNVSSQTTPSGRFKFINIDWIPFSRVIVRPTYHIIDHTLKPQTLAIVGGINPFNAIRMEFFNFAFGYYTSATSKQFDTRGTSFPQQIYRIFKILYVPTLVRADSYTLHILLDRRSNNFVYGSIMPKVDNLYPRRLEDTSHYIDGGIVAVKQTRCCNEAQLIAYLK